MQSAGCPQTQVVPEVWQHSKKGLASFHHHVVLWWWWWFPKQGLILGDKQDYMEKGGPYHIGL